MARIAVTVSVLLKLALLLSEDGKLRRHAGKADDAIGRTRIIKKKRSVSSF